MSKFRVVLGEDHALRFVYDDALAALAARGTTTRASHVEPHPTRAGWVADMRPSGGPVLGLDGEWRPTHDSGLSELPAVDKEHVGMLEPFATRQAALDAEREWLRREQGL